MLFQNGDLCFVILNLWEDVSVWRTLVCTCSSAYSVCGKWPEIFCALNLFFDAHSGESWSWVLYLFDTFDPSLADEDCISVA